LVEDVKQRQLRLARLKEELLHEKGKARAHEKTISEFVGMIHTTVQKKDEREYINDLMELFKRFVKPHADEIQDKKRKDPETIEELDRQLKYMENYIGDFKATASKNHFKSLNNIKKRTSENTELIAELAQMR
jgi:cilia- and flagella-associated protein 57